MKYYSEPAKELPIIETDIVVVGAGTAGCMAAIAAARSGAKVVLIEKHPVPTGTMGNGGNTLLSYYNTSDDPNTAIRVVGGLPYEFFKRLVSEGMSYDFIPTPKSPHYTPYMAHPNREGIKGVLCMMLDEAGVKVYLQTFLAGVVMDGDKIHYAIIENKDGRSAIEAKMFIDCSGDGDVAKYAGLELVTNWQIYDQVCGAPTSLPFGLCGIDFEKTKREAPEIFKIINDIDKDGVYLKKYQIWHQKNPERCKTLCSMDIRYFSTMYSFSDGDVLFFNNSKGQMIDASTAENLSSAEMKERIKIIKMVQALRKDVPGFENCYLNWEAMQLGIRSSKIIPCDKMMNREEIANGTRYEHEVGLYGFQDMVEKDPSTRIRGKGYYGLPYEIMVPKGVSNLYAAGRCLTLDVLAHNSTRNTVCCMVLGQAAGVSAALCAKDSVDTRSLNYDKLREALLAQDVILNL